MADDIIETAREAQTLCEQPLSLLDAVNLKRCASALARYVLEHAEAFGADAENIARLRRSSGLRDDSQPGSALLHLTDDERARFQHCFSCGTYDMGTASLLETINDLRGRLAWPRTGDDTRRLEHAAAKPPSAPPAAERKAVGDMLFDAPPSAPAANLWSGYSAQHEPPSAPAEAEPPDRVRMLEDIIEERDRAHAELVRRARELSAALDAFLERWDVSDMLPASLQRASDARDALAELLEEPSE